MVLKHSKALISRETQGTRFRCEQLKKNGKKTCTPPRLRGVRWSQRVKADLGAFPSVLKGFLLGFSLDEGSDPVLTPHPHPLDFVSGVRTGSDEVVKLVLV